MLLIHCEGDNFNKFYEKIGMKARGFFGGDNLLKKQDIFLRDNLAIDFGFWIR